MNAEPQPLNARFSALHIDVARFATDDFNPFHDRNKWQRIEGNPFGGAIALGFQLSSFALHGVSMLHAAAPLQQRYLHVRITFADAVRVDDDVMLAIKPAQLGQLIERIVDGTLSGKLAKQVFATMWSSGRDADDIIAAEGLRQVSDTHLIEVAVRDILAQNPEQVEQLRAGKDKVLGFLVGQVMKKTGGKANPALVNQLIKAALAH